MKNRSTTSLLHAFCYLPVMISLVLVLLQSGDVLAQSKKDQLPTVKVSKKRKEPIKIKPGKKPQKIKETYSGPKTSDNNSKARDDYKRPASLRKPEKSKDQYQRPASKTVNFDNSGKTANQYPSPPVEEGQEPQKRSFFQRIFHRKSALEFEGNMKRKKKEEGTDGTDYQVKVKKSKIDYEQLAKDQHLYQGNIRKAPQKRVDKQFQYKAEYMFFYAGGKRVPKPEKQEKISKQQSADLQTAGLYKVKKEKDKAASYTSYHGQIKLPTLKARTSHYKKLSKKVHQYDGDIRYRKPGKDMHPSVFHLKAKTKNSYEQKEKYRRWRLIISHIFKQSDLPKNVKEKDRKPRYDKNESEIWYY